MGWYDGMLAQIGQSYNPTWYAAYSGHSAAAKRQQAINDFESMYQDPRFATNNVVTMLDGLAQNYISNGALAASKKSDYNGAVKAWNTLLDQVVAGTSPLYKEYGIPQSQWKSVGQQMTHAVETVFRPYAPNYGSNP
jgi:hypothetical protein